MKEIMNKYNNQIKKLCILFIIYMLGFLILENRVSARTIMTDSIIDQYIPFNEYFVIPYILWFAFIGLGFCYFIFFDQDGFERTCFYLFSGMFIALIIYMIIPNGQGLRVELHNENIFQSLVSFIYSIDSSTNVCPSIHVYNSIMMMVTLLKSEKLKKRKVLLLLCFILTVLICLSTLMIKQHAFIDMVCAIALCIVVYMIGHRHWGY